jgi:hypothetical protein
MKARIVLASLLVSMMVVEVSAQRAEYDDMYFRGKDREINKAISADEAFASAKTKKQKKNDEDAMDEVVSDNEDNSNPTDSYSARNVNPEYVSRSNSEKASEDESNYYLEGYTPAPASSNSNFNNSYYNNANWARNSYYANNGWNSSYNGSCGYCDPWMGPGYGGGFYDPWMTPSYGLGPSYGWRTGWSVSFMYGNYWNPYGGYGGMYNPYYGGGFGYPGYYGGNNFYYESPRIVNYGKRPSRHSAVVQPTQRADSRTRTNTTGNVANVNSTNRTRQRQVQDEYYVRPSRRSSTSAFDNSSPWNPGGSRNGFSTPQSTQPSRSRDSYNPPTRTSSPSYTPSSSPSRGGSSGSGGGGGGGSSPRPRGGRN